MELGDKKSYVVRGLVSTSLKLKNGTKLHINNILYVLGLRKNLLSISFLEDKGHKASFVDGKFLVRGKDSSIDKARVIIVHEGRLYRVITPPSQSLVHMEINPIELCHRRYGHIHYQVIPTLKHIVHGIPDIKEDSEGVFKGCSLGKHTRKPFSNSKAMSKKILDVINYDVCGSMFEKSLGGHLYYVTFIDDHSRKTCIYLLKKKDEVFEKFKEFICEVETLTVRKMKTLRSENGGEYTSK